MNYFKQFDKVLEDNFHGDFEAMLNAPARFDRYDGIPLRIKEIDRRPKKPPVYVPVVETPEPVVEAKDDFEFAVIDLEAEMASRKKSTGVDNPVQSESNAATEPKQTSIVLKPRVASPPRGAVIQTQTREGIITETTFEGNRAQRKAYEAIVRKKAKRGNSNKGSKGKPGKSPAQEKGAAKPVNLKDMNFGFRLE